MTRLTDYTSYQDAQRLFAPERLWELFDGDAARLNIAHECIDRHADDPARVAVWIAFADGHDEPMTFRAIADLSSRFAYWLRDRGIAKGDRVAIMLEPSLTFYAALFGALKLGAVAVPLFTLFGPDGVRLRISDCEPRLLVTNPEKAREIGDSPDIPVLVADDTFIRSLDQYPTALAPQTSSGDMAIYQYTSGTTRELPEAVRHTHRAIVTLMVAALYGTGIRPGDRFFCPSCSMYGTTEVGVLLVNYPGAADFVVRPGSLGKPVPGVRVTVQAPDGTDCAPGEIGEIKVWRRDAWFPTKDRGRIDADGYFWHAGRADDVIISAGWTIGAAEVEDTLLQHPAVREAAVIGVPDATRGQVVKAFVVTGRAPDAALAAELQDFVRTRLSQHEYPRLVAFVTELPKTPAGKVNRKVLRDREAV